MLKNIKSSCITTFIAVIAVIIIIMPIQMVYVSAQIATPTPDPTICSVNSVNPECNPPRLKDFQTYLANLLAVIWGAGGIVFVALLIKIGFDYIAGAGKPEKEQELKDRAGKWFLGIVLLYFSRMFVATIMSSLIDANTPDQCYAELDQPVIQFFFADVCTKGDFAGVTTTPVVTSTPIPVVTSTPITNLTLPCTLNNMLPVTVGTWDNACQISSTPGSTNGYAYNGYGYYADCDIFDKCIIVHGIHN